MNTLFTETGNTVLQKEMKLAISPNSGKPLSKSQLLFNRLIKKIETLNKSIEKENIKLDTLLQEYSKHNIPQYEKKIAEIQIQIAKLLDKAIKENKYSLTQKSKVEEVIVWLCDNAFTALEPDEETKALYDSYAEVGYDEEVKEQELSVKEMLSGQFRQQFGMDIDLSDIDDTPEGMAKFKERLLKESENLRGNKTNSSRKKTKKQMEKETYLQQEEAVKLKSIRSIYLSLAKILHPDTVVDELEKLKKEELMKKVTVAYNEKDLSTLLKLELEWVVAESGNIDTLTEDKLNIYNSALKDQAMELEQEYNMLFHHPRYHLIANFARYSEKSALLAMKKIAESAKFRATANESILHDIQANFTRQFILKYVNEFYLLIQREHYNIPDFPFQNRW